MFDMREWRNLQDMRLEDFVALAAKHAPPGLFQFSAKWLLPIIQREDFAFTVSKVIEEDERVRSYVIDPVTGKTNEENFKILYKTAEDIYQGYKWQRRLAKVVDTLDHFLEIAAAALPGPLLEARTQQFVDLPIKLAYNAYHYLTTHDAGTSVMWAIAEVGSSINPAMASVVAPTLDLANMYDWRTENLYRGMVADAYVGLMKRTAQQRRRDEEAEANSPYGRRNRRGDDGIMDGEFTDLPDAPRPGSQYPDDGNPYERFMRPALPPPADPKDKK